MNKNWKRSRRFVKYFNELCIIDKDEQIFGNEKEVINFNLSCGQIMSFKKLNLLDQMVLSLKNDLENETKSFDAEIFEKVRDEFIARKKILETPTFHDYLSHNVFEIKNLFKQYVEDNGLEHFFQIILDEKIDEQSKLELLKGDFGDKIQDLNFDFSKWVKDEFRKWKSSGKAHIFIKNTCALNEFLKIAILSDILWSTPYQDVLDLYRKDYLSVAIKWLKKNETEKNIFINNYKLFDENMKVLETLLFCYLVIEGKYKLIELLDSFDENLPKDAQEYFVGWERKLNLKELYKYLFKFSKSLDMEFIHVSKIKSLPKDFAIANSLKGIENTFSAISHGYSEKLYFLFGLFELSELIKGAELDFNKESRSVDKKGFREFAKSNAVQIMMLHYRV